MKQVVFTVGAGMAGWRLDKTLRQQYPAWGRSAVKSILNKRQVRVNGKSVWLGSWKVNKGDRIEIKNPPVDKPKAIETFQEAWLIEDAGDIIAINKPAGLRAHATRAGGTDNLQDLARARFGDVALAHRLDRDTSGLMLLTRSNATMRAHLDHVFKAGEAHKIYLAVVGANNRLAASGQITTSLAPDPDRKDKMIAIKNGGQRAVTDYEVLAEAKGMQLLRLQPTTGRMHQLRVHLASLRAPILGDRLYGDKDSAPRLLLHAWQITIPAGQEVQGDTFSARVEEDFMKSVPAAFHSFFL